MKICKYGLPFLTLLAVGCAGSSNDNAVRIAPPTGGGGQIVDYVGSYTGDYYTAPGGHFEGGVLVADGTAARAGSVSLTVAADGAVAGSRHDEAAGIDQALSGVIDNQGRLVLSRSGAQGTRSLLGHLAKQSEGRAITTLVEGQDAAETETWYHYRLSGGSAAVGKAPLTTGRWLAGISGTASVSFSGRWHRFDTAASGTFSLTVAKSGRVTGSWNGVGAAQSIAGVLYDLDGDENGRQGFAGTVTLGGERLELRLTVASDGVSAGLVEFVGTASMPSDDVGYSVYLRTAD